MRTPSRMVTVMPFSTFMAYCVHSITSSAIESTPDGMVSPGEFAVFRLSTNWNLVGCMTGKSAGVAPLMMRPA